MIRSDHAAEIPSLVRALPLSLYTLYAPSRGFMGREISTANL